MIELNGLDTALSRHGYSIPKDQINPKELEKLKEKLTANPNQQGGYSPMG